jgi:hypothetical protein
LKKSQNQSPVTLDMATYGKSNTSHNQTCSEKEKKRRGNSERVKKWVILIVHQGQAYLK